MATKEQIKNNALSKFNEKFPKYATDMKTFENEMKNNEKFRNNVYGLTGNPEEKRDAYFRQIWGVGEIKVKEDTLSQQSDAAKQQLNINPNDIDAVATSDAPNPKMDLDEMRNVFMEEIEEQRKSLEEVKEEPRNASPMQYGGGYFESRNFEHIMPSDKGIAEKILEKTEKVLQAPSKDEGSGIGNFLQGITDNLSINDLTLGIADLADNGKILRIVKKLEKDEKLTESEESVLDALYLYNNAQMLRSDNTSTAYGAGAASKESLVFMANMILTSGVGGGAVKGVSKGISKLMTKLADKGIHRYLRSKGIEASAKNVAKYADDLMSGAVKGEGGMRALQIAGTKVAPIATDLTVGTATQTALSPKAYAMTAEEMTGRVVKDENGNYAVEGGKTAGKAIGSAMIEFLSEKVGNHIVMPKSFSQALNKIPINATARDIFTASTKLTKSAGLNSIPIEFAEEIFANELKRFTNISTKEEANQFWDPENLKVTMLSIAVIGGISPVINAPSFISYGREKNKLNETLQGIGLNQDEIKIVRNALENGSTIDAINARNYVLNRYAKSLPQAVYSVPDITLDENGNIIQADSEREIVNEVISNQNYAKLMELDKQLASFKMVSARVNYSVQAEEDRTKDGITESIMPLVNKNTNSIITAKVNVNGNEIDNVYIYGNVGVNADGSVNIDNSGLLYYATSENPLEKKPIAPSNVQVTNNQDAETLVQEEVKANSDKLKEELNNAYGVDKARNTFTPDTEVVHLENGKPMVNEKGEPLTSKVVSVDDNNIILLTADGEISVPLNMANELIQPLEPEEQPIEQDAEVNTPSNENAPAEEVLNDEAVEEVNPIFEDIRETEEDMGIPYSEIIETQESEYKKLVDKFKKKPSAENKKAVKDALQFLNEIKSNYAQYLEYKKSKEEKANAETQVDNTPKEDVPSVETPKHTYTRATKVSWKDSMGHYYEGTLEGDYIIVDGVIWGKPVIVYNNGRTKVEMTPERQQQLTIIEQVPYDIQSNPDGITIPNVEDAKETAEENSAEGVDVKDIPEMTDDTPQDARARGVRKSNGEIFKRQENVEGVQGKEVEVKFSNNNIQKGKVMVIDVNQLQASHKGGIRNPLHFIDEAQPKERTGDDSLYEAERIAKNIRPEEITTSITAYTGAPTINSRGEVIQGNNRSEALRVMYNTESEQAQKYKDYLIQHAEEFGFKAEDIQAMESPVLVNVLDVTDEEAIELGQYVAQDTESGGMERIKPINTLNKMGKDIGTFTNLLLKNSEEGVSLSELIDKNGNETLAWLNQKEYISPAQYRSAFDSRGNITVEAKNDIREILYHNIFQNANPLLKEKFNSLPVKAQRAILLTAYRDALSPKEQSILKDLQESINAYYNLMQHDDFANAKNNEQRHRALLTWLRTTQVDLATGETFVSAERYNNFVIELAQDYFTDTQKTIQQKLNKVFDIIQGTQEETLFDKPDNTPKTKEEAIKQIFNIDYNANTRSDLLEGDNSTGERGQQGSDGEIANKEQTQSGNGATDNRGGASTNAEQVKPIEEKPKRKTKKPKDNFKLSKNSLKEIDDAIKQLKLDCTAKSLLENFNNRRNLSLKDYVKLYNDIHNIYTFIESLIQFSKDTIESMYQMLNTIRQDDTFEEVQKKAFDLLRFALNNSGIRIREYKQKSGVQGFVKIGVVYGFTPQVINLNTYQPFSSYPNTLIHEYTHLWLGFLRAHDYEKYKSILNLVRKNKDLIEKYVVSKNYHYKYDSTSENYQEEVACHILGQQGYTKLLEALENKEVSNNEKTIIKEILDAINDFWNSVLSALGIKSNEKGEIENLDQLVDVVITDLLNETNPIQLYKDIIKQEVEQENAKKNEQEKKSIKFAQLESRIVNSEMLAPSNNLNQMEGESNTDYIRRATTNRITAFFEFNKKKSRLSNYIFDVIDDGHPMYEIVDELKKKGIKVPAELDIYKNWGIYRGRMQNEQKVFEALHLEKMLSACNKLVNTQPMSNVSGSNSNNLNSEYEAFCLYLRAKDIVEVQEGKNEEGKPFSDTFKARGVDAFSSHTGMSAKEYVEMYEKAVGNTELIDNVWNAINDVRKYNADLLLDAKLISKDFHKILLARKFYVPQRGWEERDALKGFMNEEYFDLKKVGQSSRNSDASSTITSGKVERKHLSGNPLAYLLNMVYDTQMRSYQNKYLLEVFVPFLEKYKDDLGGSIVEAGNYSAKAYAKAIEEGSAFTRNEKKQKYIWVINHDKSEEELEKEADEAIDEALDNADSTSDLVTANVSTGPYKAIFTNDIRMTNVLNGGHDYNSAIPNWLAVTNRFLAQTLTTYNPYFALANFLRDAQAGFFNSFIDYGPKFAGRFFINLKNNFKRVWNEEEQERFDRFLKGGGAVGYAQYKTYDDLRKDMEGLVAHGSTRGRGGKAVDFLFTEKGFISYIRKVTEFFELVSRYSAYTTALDCGMSETDALHASRDVVVDLGQRGYKTTSMGRLFVFSTAILKSALKAYKQIKDPETLWKYAVVAIGGMIVGMVQSLYGGDDDYINVSDYKRTNTLIIPFGDTRVTLPLGHGFRAFNAIGVRIGDYLQGRTSFAQCSSDAINALSGEFFPTYMNIPLALRNINDGEILKLTGQFMPSALAPLMEIATNENKFGSKISKDKYDVAKPDVLDGINPSSVSQAISKHLYEDWAGGITSYEKAIDSEGNKINYFDVSPSTIDHLANSYLRHFKFVGDIANWALAEDSDEYTTSFVKQFVNETNHYAISSSLAKKLQDEMQFYIKPQDVAKKGYITESLSGAEQKRIDKITKTLESVIQGDEFIQAIVADNGVLRLFESYSEVYEANELALQIARIDLARAETDKQEEDARSRIDEAKKAKEEFDNELHQLNINLQKALWVIKGIRTSE